MKKKIAITLAFAAALLVGTASDAYAQTTADVGILFTIPEVLVINADNPTVTIDVVAGDVDNPAGVTGTTPTVLTYSGNVTMDVDLGTVAAWTTAPATSPKPLAELNWAVTAGQGSGSGNVAGGGAVAGGVAPGTDWTTTVQYSLDAISFDEEAGSYRADVTYTLTAT